MDKVTAIANSKLPDGWREVRLEDVADIIGGGTPSSKIKEYWNGNISWITPKDLSGYNFRKIKKGSRNITQLGLSKSSAKKLSKNSILITSRAPIGYVAIADNEVTTNQGFKSLILKDGNSYEYFYYLIKSNIDKLKSVASGTTFLEISGKKFKTIKIYNSPTIRTKSHRPYPRQSRRQNRTKPPNEHHARANGTSPIQKLVRQLRPSNRQRPKSQQPNPRPIQTKSQKPPNLPIQPPTPQSHTIPIPQRIRAPRQNGLDS